MIRTGAALGARATALAALTLAAARAARRLRVPVSCDYNYRKNLWNWGRRTR